MQHSRHNWRSVLHARKSASLEEKKRTFGERGARAHHLLRHVPHFIRARVVLFPFLGLLLPPDDDFDVHEVKETRSFFRLSFSQKRARLCSTKLFPKKKRFFLRARTSFGVCVSVLVARRVTEKIYSSSSCVRFTPRESTKVEVWTYL